MPSPRQQKYPSGGYRLRQNMSNQGVRMRTFVVDVDNADPVADEPIFFRSEVRGWVTSGGYAHASCKSVALGYVRAELADEREGWEIEIIGKRQKARLQIEPLFDADGSRMRS